MVMTCSRVRKVAAPIASMLALGWASALTAQAPETQSQVRPAEADAAAADAAGANNSSGVEDIVVTAQFREQNLQDTPIAITAVSGAMLEARSQTSIQSVANQAPSVTLRESSASFGPALGANIRGIGQFDPSPAVEPGVGLYVDDVYYATLTGSVLDLLDLDRVEILRGPQGTLAGRNSIGGAIKLYSKRPTSTAAGYVSATYGIRDRIDLRASANFALTDSLFARISGVAKKQDGYVRRLDFGCVNAPGTANNPNPNAVQPVTSGGDCVVGRDGDVDTQAVRGQLRFANGGPIEINLIADYTKDDRNPVGEVLTRSGTQPPWSRRGAPNVPPASLLCGRFCNFASYSVPGGPWGGPVATGSPVNQSNFQPRNGFEGWGVSGQINWDLSDRFQLTSITAYRDYTATFTSDNDLSPYGNSLASAVNKFWSVSQELRLNGSIGADDFIEYTIGGFYMDQRSVGRQVVELLYTPFPLQFIQNDPVNADTKAAFGQAIVHATDQLSLIGGLRYTDEHKDYRFSRRNFDGSLNPFLPFDGRTGIYDGDRIDYRVSAQYEWTPDVMTYAQVSTGFKGGGINPRPFSAFQIVPFSPESVTAYELGIKADLFDRRARINIAVFQTDYSNIQLTLVPTCPALSDPTTTADDNGPCVAIANAGDGRIRGLEIETSLRPVDGLSIDGAFSYVDFDYKSINPTSGGATNLAGPQLDDVTPYTPKWKWSIGAQYEIDLGGSGSLTPRIDAAYQSVTFSNPTNAAFERMPAFTVANARLTWRNADADLEVSGEVTNLFDKYYYLTAFDNSGSAGFASAQPGRPREWALTVKKKF